DTRLERHRGANARVKVILACVDGEAPAQPLREQVNRGPAVVRERRLQECDSHGAGVDWEVGDPAVIALRGTTSWRSARRRSESRPPAKANSVRACGSSLAPQSREPMVTTFLSRRRRVAGATPYEATSRASSAAAR